MKKTKRLTYSFTIIIALLFGSLSMRAQAVFCGDTVLVDTTLTSVLACSGPGLILGASNITLDCNGLTITGSGTDTGIALDGVSGVTVKNCGVIDFAVGIFVATGADQNYIIENRVLGSTSVGNGAIEIRSNGNVVEQNTASDNTGRGFALVDAAGNIIADNFSILNGFRGIDVIDSNFNYLFRNKAIENFSGGFVISGTSSNNTLNKNFAEFSGSEGFAIFSAGNFLISNRASKNTTFGFNDTTGPANTYTNNKCIFNGTAGSSNGLLCTPQP
ncbi:MAG: parallel beta-helix repeat protein [Paraglaciecola sp.]|jgi:parallel beta-helix repeat protein